MYCSNCGLEIGPSDNFCAKCGKKLSNITKTENENKNPIELPLNSKSSATNVIPKKNTSLYVILYIGVGLAIIGCIAAVLIPWLASGKTPNGQDFFIVCFWFGLGGLILGKHRGQSGWLYFFAGCSVGLIFLLLLSFFGGLMS